MTRSSYFSISKNQSANVLFDKLANARNAMSDDAALTVLVADKLWAFVKSRALRWKMTDFSDLIVSAGDKGKINLGLSVDAKRAFIEGRGKMKDSGPLIAAVVLKGALLGILAFKALFLLAGINTRLDHWRRRLLTSISPWFRKSASCQQTLVAAGQLDWCQKAAVGQAKTRFLWNRQWPPQIRQLQVTATASGKHAKHWLAARIGHDARLVYWKFFKEI